MNTSWNHYLFSNRPRFCSASASSLYYFFDALEFNCFSFRLSFIFLSIFFSCALPIINLSVVTHLLTFLLALADSCERGDETSGSIKGYGRVVIVRL